MGFMSPTSQEEENAILSDPHEVKILANPEILGPSDYQEDMLPSIATGPEAQVAHGQRPGPETGIAR